MLGGFLQQRRKHSAERGSALPKQVVHYPRRA